MKTITEAAKIVGLSRRMIQEYEGARVAIKPSRRNKYGYLMYDEVCINRLWQIRFYKELGYGKAAIKKIFDNPSYDHAAALGSQIEMLEKKKQEIENLISVAQLMKETGITPQSMQPKTTVPGATYNDTVGFLGAWARQIKAVEQIDSYSDVVFTGEQGGLLFEAFERGISLYREGHSYDDSVVQDVVREFHAAAKPFISGLVSGLLLVAYLIAPGSEGARAIEEDYQLPGVAEYLQLAITKYCEDNIDSGPDKAIHETLDEIVTLGKQKFKAGSSEVQAVVKKLFDCYNTEATVSYLSPMDMLRSVIGYYRDPGMMPVIDKLFRGKGAGKYLAAAIECYCNSHDDNL